MAQAAATDIAKLEVMAHQASSSLRILRLCKECMHSYLRVQTKLILEALQS